MGEHDDVCVISHTSSELPSADKRLRDEKQKEKKPTSTSNHPLSNSQPLGVMGSSRDTYTANTQQKVYDSRGHLHDFAANTQRKTA